MPISIAGKIAWLTYLTGFWCYLLLGGLAEWPRLPFIAWLSYVSVQAGGVLACSRCSGLFGIFMNLGIGGLVELGLMAKR